MTKKIHLLTNFSTYLRSFSPILVVGEQIKMLQRAGYTPVLLASETWEPPEDSVFGSVETKLMFPTAAHGADDRPQNIDELVELAYTQLKDILPADATVITHDLIFLPDYTILNLAARRLAKERPKTRWLHWVHSATGPGTIAKERAMYGEAYENALSEKFPNSLVCYPNAQDIPRVARNFGFEEFEVVEVPHSTDPTEGMSPLVQRLYDDLHLGDKEILMIAPARLDRGKSLHNIVRVVAGVKAAGGTAHVIFCDFQSTGGDKVTYREEMKLLARQLDVEEDVTFLSEFDDMAQMDVPHSVILELFSLSNVFILPSRSETYSLVAQEAMLKGNLCILNHDFPAFRQIYGKNALYRQFDGAEVGFDGFDGKIDTNHSDPNDYFRTRFGIALKGWLENDTVLRAKTHVRVRRNPDYIFREYIEPLLMEGEQDVMVPQEAINR